MSSPLAPMSWWRSRSSWHVPKGMRRDADPAGRVFFLLGAAQHAFHAREQLAQVERLADVVVGPHFEPNHAVDHLARRGQHDDRHVVALAQPAREREPVLAWQTHVEQHEVGQLGGERLAHRRAVGGLADLVAVRGEIVGNGLADLAVVLDDQYAAGLSHGGEHSSVHGSRKASMAPSRAEPPR